jgi:hypothetical protein
MFRWGGLCVEEKPAAEIRRIEIRQNGETILGHLFTAAEVLGNDRPIIFPGRKALPSLTSWPYLIQTMSIQTFM